MHLFGLNRRRSENLLLILGQLVLIAYVFQVAAVDHWHVDPGHDVTGIPGTSQHAVHCHGDSSGCADSGTGATNFASDQTIKLPSQSPPHRFAMDLGASSDYFAYIAAIPEPPQAA